MSRLLRWVGVTCLLLSSLCACARQVKTGTDSATLVPVVPQSSGDRVVSEAVIEPARWANLSFDAAGKLAQVAVLPGEHVSTGQMLLHLDTAQLDLAYQRAEQDVIVYQAALDSLVGGASETVITRADRDNARATEQAQITARIKQLQLEKARAEEAARAETAVADRAAANARVKQLERQLAQSTAQDPLPEVTMAQVELERSQIRLGEVRDEYNKALDRPWEPQEVRDSLARQLRQAELDFEWTEAELERARANRTAHTIGLEAMAAQLEEAKAQLAKTIAVQKSYTQTLDILAVEVEAAQLELKALQEWENPYHDQPSGEEIAQAQARLDQALLTVAETELQLQEAEIRAPFDGVVVNVHVHVGDPVTPGQTVIVLATLDQLYATTVNLTELDVVHVAVGQPVEVQVDALPGQVFLGTVHDIALQGQDWRGDVVYTVTVALTDDQDASLVRWGMSVMVTIRTGG